MSIVLTDADYGKTDIRVVKLFRSEPQHRLKDVEIRVLLTGQFDRGYTTGDNTDWLSTDTIRNISYATARTGFRASIEEYGAEIAAQILEVAPLVHAATIELAERRWTRLITDGKPHDHVFVRDVGLRTAKVHNDGESVRFSSGITDYSVLKTAESGWEGYLQDPFTTLPETNDRVLATTVTATWDYVAGARPDFDALWPAVIEQILTTFSDHYSYGVQNDVYLIGRAVLARFAEIDRIHLSLPNLHHLLFNLEPFGLSNDHEVFHATTEPRGLLRGAVARA